VLHVVADGRALATLTRRRLTLTAPLNTMFAGLGVIGDRENGAQAELLAAPVPRPLLVLGNLVVALGVTALTRRDRA
jgi:hypothetical protein